MNSLFDWCNFSFILYFDLAKRFQKDDSHLGKSSVMKILQVKVIP